MTASICTLLFLAVVGSSQAAPVAEPETVPAGAPSECVTAELRRIQASATQTTYSHRTRVDEAAGLYEFDCSGLACYVLQRRLPEHYQAIKTLKKRPRPLAIDFYEHFARSPATAAGARGWRRIPRLLDARPGDLVAWPSSNPQRGSTGHVVFIDGVPRREQDGQVRVSVIDSTSSPHAADSRTKGQTGFGRGVMWFVLDEDGRPIAYRSQSPAGKLRERPIAIGRPLPLRPSSAE